MYSTRFLPFFLLAVLIFSSCAHFPKFQSESPAAVSPAEQPPAVKPAPAPGPTVPPAPAVKPSPAPAPAVTPASQGNGQTLSPVQLEILRTLPMGIIGGTETVHIENIPSALAAKVDTGADTCSLHAANLKYFERDGRSWVSFQFAEPGTGKIHTFERRVKRRPKIKRHGAESVQRPVVEMKIRLGEHLFKCDFTLTDRGRFTFPILIGQNLLNGRAAVDVSRSNVLGR